MRVFPNPPTVFFRMWEEMLESMAATQQVLRYPAGSTVSSTDREEDDEYSDENIREWIEEDKLEKWDPKLAEWLKAELRE